MVGTSMNDRSRNYKKGIDADKGRRNRNDTRLQLRKNKREEGLQKRRAMASAQTTEPAPVDSNLPNNISMTSSKEAPKKFSRSDIPALTATIQNHEATNEDILYAITGFRKMLSVERSPPVKEVIESNVLTKFVQLLTHADEKIQFEATWALTNVASTEFTRTVVEYGAVKYLVAMLLSANADVREQSAWCLGNIAGDAPDLRDLVLGEGAMGSLLKNIENPANDSLLSNCVWALSNFCRGKPQPHLDTVAPAIPYLAQLIMTENKTSLMDACWALSYISDGEDNRIETVMNTGVTPALVKMLGSDSASFVTPALRTLGNFVSGNDSQTQAVVDAGALQHAEALLSHSKRNIRKETCWLISNIAAGNQSQISQLVSNQRVLSGVINHVQGAEWEVRKEATWVLSNIATGGADGHVHALVELGGIDALCTVIDVADPKILLVVLDAIESILRVGRNCGRDYNGFVDECDGLDKIENLQSHDNESVYEKSIHIIENYFGVEEGEDENLVPTITGNTFAFGLPTDKNAEMTGVGQVQSAPLQPFNF